MSPEACAKKRSREPTAVPCECERPNAGDVYSPWEDVTPVTEGNEAGRPELAQKKWSRKPSAVPCECERRNVGDVYSSWGEVTSVTDGREAGRPELAQKVVEGAYCRSVIVRATKRRRRIFSLGRCHVSDRGERNREARARTERGRGNSHGLFQCELGPRGFFPLCH